MSEKISLDSSDSVYNIQKISLVSRQGLFTTQTQNKTRQNYYAILPVYAGEAYVLVTDIHIYINSFRLICTL